MTTPDSDLHSDGPRIAIASCGRLMPDGDIDDQLLAKALADLGIRAEIRSWSDPAVEWDTFDATVIRSAWDYTDHRDDFLDWAKSTPRLYNPAQVIVTNSDKTYLHDLALAGIAVVPTVFAAPGEALPLPDKGEFVVKPSVGAGSRGAGRFDARTEAAQAREHGDALHRAGRTVMVQPYFTGVDAAGETALIYLDGRFSHAIRKGPLLPPASRHDLDTVQLYVLEQISSRIPSAAERDVADRVISHYSAVPSVNGPAVDGQAVDGVSPSPLLYARVDLLPHPDGPVVIEVELTEPSLFLSYSPTAAAELASAVARRLQGRRVGDVPTAEQAS